MQGSDDVSREIQQTIQKARQEARQAVEEMRGEQIREAEEELREAREQLRNARTDDQRGAAEQSIGAAEAQLKAARNIRFDDHDALETHTGQPPMPPHDMIPPQAVDIAMGFFMMCAVMVVGWPLARAFGRRIERGGSAAAGAVPAGVADQLQRIEQAVEAMSVEVERISESQRFLARLQNESGAAKERR